MNHEKILKAQKQNDKIVQKIYQKNPRLSGKIVFKTILSLKK